MPGPVVIKDRPVYRGDPYEIRFVFKNPDDTVRDVSGAEWEPQLADQEDWAVDTSQAEQGIVCLTLTGAQTARLQDPFVRWDLAELNIWGRTVFSGRLRMEGQVE